jgi:hypothetical protein
MAPEIHERYQRAGDLLDDVLAARDGATPQPMRRVGALVPAEAGPTTSEEIQSRLKARESPVPRFCWHCRKPLHARSDRCPFCGEAQ